ncbi:SPOR domain-containing protein [Ferrimonas balearica]|uniref:SPOR domain-containing protein n=1 Tax=Ferrimonas balearica TaxID=44012 RepID=UPI001C997087|nr:AAA family ATPase [Ferrimonas balearica]MBY5992097.1 AAA family ATPase [Ferrimonas balearica]
MTVPPASLPLLPSQRALLERFRYLTEYGDHLLLLHGIDGVGKSTLAQSLLTDAEEFNQAYLSVEAGMDPALARERLVRQLVAEPVFDNQDPLGDSLERLLPPNHARLMLVVDNAHRLADTLMAELMALVLSDEPSGLRVTLVLVSDDALVSRLQQQLPEHYQSHLLPVEVPPLSDRERRKLYDQLVARYQGKLFLNEAAIERQLAEQDGSARAVVALAEAAKSRPVAGQGLRRPVITGAIALLALILLAVGIWWPVAKDPASETQAPVEVVNAETDLPEASAPAVAEAEANADAVTVAGLAKPWPTEPERDETPVPFEPDSPEPTEAPLATTEVPEGETEAAETPVALAQTSEPLEETASAEPTPEPEPEPQPLGQQPLMARPAQSYVLQLAVFSYPQLIPDFLASHGLADQVRVYRIDREPMPWFVVVQGGYQSKAEAREAREALVESVRRLSPYVKPVAKVQSELAAELELTEILSPQG